MVHLSSHPTPEMEMFRKELCTWVWDRLQRFVLFRPLETSQLSNELSDIFGYNSDHKAFGLPTIETQEAHPRLQEMLLQLRESSNKHCAVLQPPAASQTLSSEDSSCIASSAKRPFLNSALSRCKAMYHGSVKMMTAKWLFMQSVLMLYI